MKPSLPCKLEAPLKLVCVEVLKQGSYCFEALAVEAPAVVLVEAGLIAGKPIESRSSGSIRPLARIRHVEALAV